MDKTSKRGSWRGLFLKEWAFLKWTFLTLLLINLIITVFETSPIAAGLLNKDITEAISVSNIWFYLHMYLGLILLLTSLMNEMKRVDIWLHSAMSIIKLIGAKIVFSFFAVTCSFLLCGVVISVFSYIGGVGSITAIIISYISTTFVLVLNVVFLLMFFFFFWSVYQVLKSRMGPIAILVTMMLVPVSALFWAFIWFTDWFQFIKEMGPILDFRTMTSDLPYFAETNFILAGLMPEDAILSVGSLLLYIVLSSALFIGGTTLFEKKVRL